MARLARSLTAALAGLFVACGQAQDNTDFTALAQAGGCLACHAEDRKVLGPSWRAIAERYRGQPEARAVLIESVAKGSRGKWADEGIAVPMPPYSPRVSRENIERLVDEILRFGGG